MEGTIILYDSNEKELVRKHYSLSKRYFSTIEDWKVDYPDGHYVHFLPETKEISDVAFDNLWYKNQKKKREKSTYNPRVYSIPKPTRISFYKP